MSILIWLGWSSHYWSGLLKCPIICLFLVNIQHGHLTCIHALDSWCLQIEQVQTRSPSFTRDFAELNVALSSGWFKRWSCSFERTPTYSQYAKSEIPIVIKTMLKITERNANRTTPDASTINARTRIQRSGVGLLEALFDSIFAARSILFSPSLCSLWLLFLSSLASTLLPFKFSRPSQPYLSYPWYLITNSQ